MPSSLTPIDQALATLLEHLSLKATTETIALDAALGKVLAQDQVAGLDVPAYNNSAMDGYALRSADMKAPGAVFECSQTIAAGHPGSPLKPGTVARIFTGAPIPEGADTVVIQENTEQTTGGIVIHEIPELGKNVRLRGHDIKQGTTVLQAGHLLQPQDLGLLASLGINTINVYRPLTVAIINTGDEVVEPGKALKPGQLYDSNSYTLAGLLQRIGMRVIKLGIVEDTLAATEKMLQQAAEQADCIITTGGVSVGDEDHVRAAVSNQGELKLWKLAIKPGKPFSYGRVANKPFFGLPGNPVAVFVTFVTLVRPCLLKMQGASDILVPTIAAKLAYSILDTGTRQEYVRARLNFDSNAEPVLQTFSDQSSSIMTSLSWAEGLAVIPAHSNLAVDDRVMFIPFSGLY